MSDAEQAAPRSDGVAEMLDKIQAACVGHDVRDVAVASLLVAAETSVMAFDYDTTKARDWLIRYLDTSVDAVEREMSERLAEAILIPNGEEVAGGQCGE